MNMCMWVLHPAVLCVAATTSSSITLSFFSIFLFLYCFNSSNPCLSRRQFTNTYYKFSGMVCAHRCRSPVVVSRTATSRNNGKVFFGLHYYDIGSSCACKHPLQLSNHTQFVWIWIWGKLALCAIVAELAFGCCWFCMSFGFRLMNECYIHKGPHQRH